MTSSIKIPTPHSNELRVTGLPAAGVLSEGGDGHGGAAIEKVHCSSSGNG